LENRILDLTPEILEENYMNFDMCLLAAYSETNFKIFLKDSETEGFLANLRDAEVDIKLPMKIVTKNLKGKNMAVILDYYEEVLEIIQTKDLSRGIILESDYPRLVQAILIYIVDYYNRDKELFSNDDITGQVSFITNYFMDHLSVLIYLSILYEYNQIEKMEIDEDRKLCISNLLKMYLSCKVCKLTGSIMGKELEAFREKAKQCEIEANKKERVILKKKKIIEKLRVEMKAQSAKAEETVSNNCDKYKAELQRCREAYDEEVKKFEEMEESMVPKDAYLKKEKEIADVHAKYCDRGRQINELIKKLDEAHVGKEIQIFENYLKNRGLSDELYQLMYPYYDAYISGVIPDAELEGDRLSFVGYTRLVDGQHHVFNAKGTGFRLFNLPKEIYLAENQFIAVSSKNTYIKSYDCFYEGDREVSSFAEVSSLNPVCVYTTKNNEEKVWQNAISGLFRGDIVGLDNGKGVMTKYERHEIFIKSLLSSVLAKGHGAYYVIKTVANGSLVYDFADRTDKVLAIEDVKLKDKSIVTLNGREFVRYFDDEEFIASSLPVDGCRMGFYKETERGIFITFGDGTCQLFSAFELSKGLAGRTFEDGEILEINGFDMVVDVYECECSGEETDESKIKSRREKVRRTEKRELESLLDTVEKHTEKVLVIGSEKFANGYRNNFLKNGYEAEVVSGHGTYFDIHKAALKSDKIIFVTTAASHKNYYQIKNDFGDNILYADSDGFRCLIELINRSQVV
jgi:hypothetical protein